MADPAPEEPEDTPTSPRNLDRRGQMRDTAIQQGQAAVDDGKARGKKAPADDDGLSAQAGRRAGALA